MEKAHDWKYVKSKSKGRRPAAQHKTGDSDYSPNNYAMAVDADHSSSTISTSPQSLVAPPPGVDFVLFDDQEDALGDDDDPLYPHYGDSAESYLPWTSPMTRLRDNELLIERFSQTYNSMQENPSTAASSSDAELDPGLSNFALHGIQHYPQADAHAPFVGDAAIKMESPVMTIDSVFPRKRKYEPVEVPSGQLEQAPTAASGVGPNRSRKAGAGQGAPTPSKARLASKCRDSSGEDGCRPKKKIKPNSTEDFTDTSMPDIFRHAHPDIYDRNRMDKYSPCHTVHREISTLVRHLSRPAHRLNVTERTISSFDIVDPDFRHPRVGVCRSCWQTFGDRSAFDAHLSRPCQRVSKGKREKWRVLFESFTPLHDATDIALSSADSTQQTEEQWERFSDHLDDALVPDEDDDVRTPSTSVPSPVPLQLAGFAPVDPAAGRFVSADEHDRLQREHEALRERHQQLERMTQALLIQRLFQENMKPTTAPGPDTKPPSLGSPKKSCPATSPAVSDRDNLVQHMDSQSTDVDVHAFMEEMEDTRQSLSRMNSGLTIASRSTIHRVPPSPPSRRAELPGAKTAADQPSHQAKAPLAHRPPPPSIPDSGYGTENRRGSLGDLPGQHSTTTKPLTPPSTAEAAAAEDNKKTSGGVGIIPWGEGPSPQRTPRANTSSSSLSPHHSQASQPSQPGGFLTDQEMADYDDDSYNLFYDNILHARSSPPGFTF
ncbi:hypothetical protein C8A01DRAFT_12503 [Parachaetomium inaequale]|uniref:C2H2-type domain-containing protein n=1 Tax=Parachaetomium inaequale TaxID=2588326 RepID=A0AAN6PSC4_9PEZI|nr:hypothetical protein C8A01DRAFT_12503 [Parachaetomium inaequale]